MSDSNKEKVTQEMIDAVEKSLEQAVEKYDGQVQENGKAATEARDEVKSLSEKHAELVEKFEAEQEKFQEFRQDIETRGAPGNRVPDPTWGKQFIDSEKFEALVSGESKYARIDVKNTILGEGGSPQDPEDTLVPADRLPGIYGGVFRQLSILDFMPAGTTGSNQIEYTRENSWTNDAAETAEGGQKPESDLTFTLVNDPVRTIAHFIKVSKQVLDDAPLLQSYIDRRLRHGLRNRLEFQLLRGDGTSPNISGLSDTGRHTAFTPSSDDTQFDSISKAKYNIIGNDRMPSVVFMNPEDWGNMERLKINSTDDRYIAGEGAALSYIQNGMTPLVWGLPVVASNNVESGKFYVLDPNEILLAMRQGAMVEMFAQDEDNVQKNLLTIRAEMRAALAVFAATAIEYGDLIV